MKVHHRQSEAPAAPVNGLVRPRRSETTRPVVFYAAAILLSAATVFAYWPGLYGPFLFDDFGSLSELGDLGGVRDWTTFKAFVFGGDAGPTGRPLALLTFLIDGNTWPTDPWPFKRTNLAIHLLNGAIVGFLSHRILRLADVGQRKSRWLALLSAALWLLHPFLVSTTLYAVQRMAQLSTLFVLLGLTFHLLGRSSLPKRPVRAYIVMSVSLCLFTGLAALCKENGALLPLLIGVMELTIFADKSQRHAALNRSWSIVFLLAPSLALVTYLGTFTLGGRWLEPDVIRGISIYERVLTEARILIDYLRHWFVPTLYTSGVFQDHYIPSSGFLRPISTALSTLFHVTVLTTCVLKRKEWPLLAFAVLFFYTAHLMESTVINLELYFEHRNYLAAAFLFLPVVAALERVLDQRAYIAVFTLMLLTFTGFTRYSSGIWASYPSLVEAAVKAAPTSARAQQQYSQILFNAGDYAGSMNVINAALEYSPENQSLLLHKAIVECRLGTLEDAEFSRISSILASDVYDLRNLKSYRTLVTMVIDGGCPAVSLPTLRQTFQDMLSLPVNADPKYMAYSQIMYFIGRIDVHLDEPQRAGESFRQSLNSRPDASRAMVIASIFASNGYFAEALEFADVATTYLSAPTGGIVSGPTVRKSDIDDFRRQVRAEIETASDRQ